MVTADRRPASIWILIEADLDCADSVRASVDEDTVAIEIFSQTKESGEVITLGRWNGG